MMNSSNRGGADADAVVCEFVRQRCTHDALFQPFYKRSNRTKGSKILRCFPHCCPNHAHRGFCGSSLHVRVQWGTPSARGARPPMVHVFGRFRLTDTAPLPIGHRLVAASVLSAVQSDDSPNSEWIASQIIYSWSETNWLFEINNAARWFYGWESSTVKSQRLKDHVLDVYVMAAPSAPSAAPPFGSSSQEYLQVVASTTSSSFQLISFRRATDDAMLALSATHHMRQQLQGTHTDQEEKGPVVPHPSYSAAPPPLPHAAVPRFSTSSSASSIHSTPVSSMALPSLRPPFGAAGGMSSSAMIPPRDAPPAQWSAPPLVHRPPVAAAGGPQVGWRRDRHTAPAQHPQASTTQPTSGKTVWEITNLLGQLHQIPLADAFERVAWMHETVAHYVATYKAGVDKKPPQLAASSSSSSAAQFELTLRHAVSAIDAPPAVSPLRKTPSRLLAILTELAMWLLFDPQTASQTRAALENAQAVLLDPLMVRRHFGRTMYWLHDHVNRFLHVRFNRSIRDLLLECQELGFQILFEAPGVPSAASPLKSAALPKTKGMDVFVAQLREMHVTARPTKRRRIATASSSSSGASSASGGLHPHRPLPPPPAAHTAMQRLFNAQWTCLTDRISLRRARPASPLPSGTGVPSTTHAFSLLSLIWFWRQFSVITLQLHDDEPRLEVSSLFSSTPLRSVLLLDGKDRFFRAFPAGESTLATCIGRYTFGDYVGQYAPAVGELQFFCYAFLSPTQLPSPPSSSSSSSSSTERTESVPLEHVARDACYCYHVRLLVTPTSTLVANVTVKRGELEVAALRQVGYASAHQLLTEMATWTLQQKLSAVRSFEDLHHAELVYTQQ